MATTPTPHSHKLSFSRVFSPFKKGVKIPKIIAITSLSSLVHETLEVIDVWQPKSYRSSHIDSYLAKAMIDPAHAIDSALSVYLGTSTKTNRTPLTSIPFNAHQLLSGNVWHHGSVYEIFVKGAPEQVMAKSDMTENEREEVEVAIHKLSSLGSTVIGVAHGTLASPVDMLDQLSDHPRLHFDGLIVIGHTIKPLVRRAIHQLHKDGAVIMLLTGSHTTTAFHTAHQLGIATSRSHVLERRHVDVMNDKLLREAMESVRVFTRIDKETRQRILSILPGKNTTIVATVSDLTKLTRNNT